MRRFPSLTLSIAAVLFALVADAPAALADLRFESEITYTVEIEQGLLTVSSELTLTNLTPNETDGGVIKRFFYDEIAIVLPDTIEDFRAFHGENQLKHTVEPATEPDQERLVVATIDLGRRLFFRDTMELYIEYDIPGDPPRSETFFRVNPAFISFGAYGWGDPGLTTVKVRAPILFDFDVQGAELAETGTEGHLRVWTVTGIEDPASFYLYVQGRYDEALTITKAAVEEADVIIRSWPDDEEWATNIREYVEVGLPVLQELIGLDWVPDTHLQILESGEVSTSGYGGWYLGDTEIIEVGEWADAHIVLHELSHTWLNPRLFQERWITEGLAEEFASEATRRAGLVTGPRPDLTAPEPNSDVGALNDWLTPFELEEDDLPDDLDGYEEYGYQASTYVVRRLTEEIGIEAMAEIVAAAANDLIAYRGEAPAETVAPTDDWRRFLDLLEEQGNSGQATALFERWVTDFDLGPRSEARAAYQALLIEGETWSPPVGVREQMSAWEFESAMSMINQALKVLESRTLIEANISTLGIEGLSELEMAYESAGETFTDVQDLADSYLTASTRVLAAWEQAAEDRGFLESVGLVGRNLDYEVAEAVEFLGLEAVDAAEAEATEVLGLLEGAADEGGQRLTIAGGLAALGAGGIVLGRSRRRRRNILDEGEDVQPLGR